MAITNISKPSPAITNPTSTPVQYETWDSNTTTWDTEVRTWNQMGTTWSNTQSPLYQFLLLETGGYLLLESNEKIITASGSNITNVVRP